jgi:hypothetical protein
MAKITVDQLISRVLSKVNGDVAKDDFDNDDILMAVNGCLAHIATVIDIKQLATVSEVILSADENTVSLPSDFCKNLVYAYNKTTNRPVKVYDSRRLIDRKINKITGGNVVCIAPDGDENIYYQYIPPSNQTLDIYYHKMPDDLSIGGDFPSWIPNNFIYKLFFNYVVNELYDYVESGIEGQNIEGSKTNTVWHQERFNEVLAQFSKFIGPDPDTPFIPEMNFDFEDI